jgi:hypothetical protein
MRRAGGQKIEDALWLIKTGHSEVGPVSTDEMVAMIESGEVSARTIVKTVTGPEAWLRIDATPLLDLARLEPRTASKLACFMAGAVLAALTALGPVTPTMAQSSKGTTSPNYCGTAAVEDLARLIGGRVGTVVGNGSTEFEAPEIPAGDTISVRCGSSPQTYGIYSRRDWAPAFLNAFLAIAEKSVGRPKLELSKAMNMALTLSARRTARRWRSRSQFESSGL